MPVSMSLCAVNSSAWLQNSINNHLTESCFSLKNMNDVNLTGDSYIKVVHGDDQCKVHLG